MKHLYRPGVICFACFDNLFY